MDLDFEFERIRFAFDKVKEDMNSLRKDIIDLKRENKVLKEKLKEKPKVTKTAPKTKTVVKAVKVRHDIVGNTRTNKVHYSTCVYAKKIQKENLEKFDTIKDALKKGYNRCTCIFNS